MARPKSKYPTELELEILKILWKEGELNVRQVREFLAESGRDLAHTTLVTMLTPSNYIKQAIVKISIHHRHNNQIQRYIS